MGVKLYDDAIVSKFKQWTQRTNIHIYSPSETKRIFEIIAEQSNDKPVGLPFIGLSRVGGYTILNTQMQPMTYDGLTLKANQKASLQLNAIPIQIDYQVDVYTRQLSEADDYVRNLVFNIINFPSLEVHVPYRDYDIKHKASIQLAAQEVADNSSIPERLITGQFTRLSLMITVNDAYLWDLRVRDNYSLDIITEIQ